ncbi:tetraspanin-2 [Spea bombifrons]|uniref:tetraspanin-2 n=1 Tax=Spea bombifrons TaxID=233779 RepID=UPI00234A513D|nr:tetraspanin-2 [Spea bombifrons]
MGRLSGALRCVKYLLLTFNLIFLLAGTAVIAIGLWLRFNWKIEDLNVHFNDDKEFFGAFFMGLYVLIGAGVLMMIIGFFGCCGAARESQCLLGAFFACLLVIFAAEVAAGVFAFLGKTSTIDALKESYSKAFNNFPNNPEANSTLSSFHREMQCCGNQDPESVKHVGSLCHPDHQEHKDCIQEIDKQFNHAFQIVGILAITTAGITIFGMIFSMVLCCAIRNSRDML